jgi:hypothetical protein
MGALPSAWIMMLRSMVNWIYEYNYECKIHGTLAVKNSRMLFFFWRTEEHWKLVCMVSCRTVQGQKRCAKRQVKPAPDRARLGGLQRLVCHSSGLLLYEVTFISQVTCVWLAALRLLRRSPILESSKAYFYSLIFWIQCPLELNKLMLWFSNLGMVGIWDVRGLIFN